MLSLRGFGGVTWGDRLFLCLFPTPPCCSHALTPLALKPDCDHRYQHGWSRKGIRAGLRTVVFGIGVCRLRSICPASRVELDSGLENRLCLALHIGFPVPVVLWTVNCQHPGPCMPASCMVALPGSLHV